MLAGLAAPVQTVTGPHGGRQPCHRTSLRRRRCPARPGGAANEKAVTQVTRVRILFTGGTTTARQADWRRRRGAGGSRHVGGGRRGAGSESGGAEEVMGDRSVAGVQRPLPKINTHSSFRTANNSIYIFNVLKKQDSKNNYFYKWVFRRKDIQI